MPQYGKHYVVAEIGSKFVVIERELWRREPGLSIATLIGKSSEYSIHDDRESADEVCKVANEQTGTAKS